MVRHLATRTEPGEELLGVRGQEGEPMPEPGMIVGLLPEVLVPVEVQQDSERPLLVLRFRVREDHFRCRDCGWGDATEARGTHPGCCPECSSKRTAAVHGWRGTPKEE